MYRRSLPSFLLLLFAVSGVAVAGSWGKVENLHYGEALYHFHQGKYLDALMALDVAETGHGLAPNEDQAQLLRGSLYLAYGLPGAASELFRDVLDRFEAPEIVAQAWLQLARIHFRSGEVEEAARVLARIGEALPPSRLPQRDLLTVEIALARDDPDTALRVVEGMAAVRELHYARFNTGVWLLAHGRREEGVTLLDRVGTLDSRGDPELAALRDKANVALGYTWVRNDDPNRVTTYLQRVRLEGPFSNKALLGLGWGYAEAGLFRRALDPWLLLSSRSHLDPAVQESLLAAPYAMEKLGARRQALEFYLNSVAGLSQERERIGEAIASIRDGGFLEELLATNPDRKGIAWSWQLERLPDHPASHYLRHVLAGNRFQQGLRRYRELQEIENRLADKAADMVVLEQMLETRRQAFHDRLPKIEERLARHEIQDLRGRRDRLSRQLEEIASGERPLALANDRELRLLARLERAEERLQRLQGLGDTGDAAEKLRLLRGVLYWQIASDFAPRRWAARRALRDLDQALEELERQMTSLKRARHSAPEGFEGYDTRIDSNRHRIRLLLAESRTLRNHQAEQLKALALEGLEAQRSRLGNYLVQARFAIARLYDELAQEFPAVERPSGAALPPATGEIR